MSSGSYLLDIHSHTHVFAPLRVDVLDGLDGLRADKESGVVGGEEVEVFGTYRGNEWSNKGEKLAVKEVDGRGGVWGFDVRVLGGKEYLVTKTGCEFALSALPPPLFPLLT